MNELTYYVKEISQNTFDVLMITNSNLRIIYYYDVV
jgi:hypothetical protein